MTDTSLRTPLRPLGQILSARAKGEDTRKIERENIKRRHDDNKESTLMRAQGAFVIGVCSFAFILRLLCAWSSRGLRPSEPKSQRAGASVVAQRANVVDSRGASLPQIWIPIRFMLKPRI